MNINDDNNETECHNIELNNYNANESDNETEVVESKCDSYATNILSLENIIDKGRKEIICDNYYEIRLRKKQRIE